MELDDYRADGALGVRAATDDLMRTIATRTGQPLVNSYARQWGLHGERSDAA